MKIYNFVSIIKYIHKYIYKNKNYIITQIHNVINKINQYLNEQYIKSH